MLKFGTNEGNVAFLELFTSNYSRIRAYIFALVPNSSDADDIFQETSKILWEKFEKFEIGTNFCAWAITIAKLQVLKYRSKYNTKVQLSSDMIELLSKESFKLLDNESDRLDALRSCLKKLKDKDQLLINYRFVQKKTARELSMLIGVAMNTIYRNESRILSLLMKCICRKLEISEI